MGFVKKPTVSSLSKALDVSRPTIYVWLEKYGAECPGLGDVEGWQKLIVAKNLTHAGPRAGKERESLIQQKLSQEIRLLKTKNAKEEKSVVDRGEMDELLLHISTLQRTILHQRLGRELGPKCEGKSAAEMNVFGTQTADEICDIFTQKLDQWRQT